MSEAAPDDDARLIARCRARDARAWRELVGRYQRLVHAVVRSLGLDEHHAADVFQTVFTRLHASLDRIQQPERLQAWIVTTAKREGLLQLRRARRTVSLDPAGPEDADPVDEPVDEALLPDQRLDLLQQLHAVRDGLERLDERCRRLLGLLFTDADERPAYDEIAARLGMPVGSIGPTRARCLGKLRGLIEPGA